ncbi:hypothetical protein [Sphingobacterium sp. MYb388]|uniref:hypothetical protein n=1 Tax=Sphingobacterium sp. MYb388 TaxID=2745437 RepID=UPI0030AD47C3
MNIKVYSKSKRVLEKDGHKYLSESSDSETGLLYFRVDWSKRMDQISSSRFKIVVTCLEPLDYSFLNVKDKKVEHGSESISCEVIRSEIIKFIPFNLKKLKQPVEVDATFEIELRELADEVILSAALTLSTQKII